jgi:hypothetical protein
MPKRIEKLDAILFIDTNIYLDFYRIRKSEVSLKYLEEIERHKESIILTNQVEMEYKKNRQVVILEAFSELNKLNPQNQNFPTILFDTKPSEIIKDSNKKIAEQQKKLKNRLQSILSNPSINDKVYQTLKRLFKTKSCYNLDRLKNERFAIRKKAIKRFALGYPPRKKNDTSIGDSINWEWILHCAQNSDKHIIIVSRDGDYGINFNEDNLLNDWLKQEFSERVSPRRKIILTDKLSTAFKYLKIPTTKQMEDEEKNIVTESKKLDFGVLLRQNGLDWNLFEKMIESQNINNT